jgi:hypothetical protein
VSIHAGPTGYRVRVDGHLEDHWSAWFGDLTLTHESDGTTSLSGFVSDQAALHGLLMKVRDLGIILISVEAIDPPGKRARNGSGGAGEGGQVLRARCSALARPSRTTSSPNSNSAP